MASNLWWSVGDHGTASTEIDLLESTSHYVRYRTILAPPSPRNTDTRTISMDIVIIGATSIELVDNFRELITMEQQTHANEGVFGKGLPCTLGADFFLTGEMVFFDLVDAEVIPKEIYPDFMIVTLRLTALPYGRGDEILYPMSSVFTNGEGAMVFRADVPGDADALCSFVFEDHSTGGSVVNRLRLSRYALPEMDPSDYVPFQDLGTNTITLSPAYQTLTTIAKPAGMRTEGLMDIWLDVEDHSEPIPALSDGDGGGGGGGGAPGALTVSLTAPEIGFRGGGITEATLPTTMTVEMEPPQEGDTILIILGWSTTVGDVSTADPAGFDRAVNTGFSRDFPRQLEPFGGSGSIGYYPQTLQPGTIFLGYSADGEWHLETITPLDTSYGVGLVYTATFTGRLEVWTKVASDVETGSYSVIFNTFPGRAVMAVMAFSGTYGGNVDSEDDATDLPHVAGTNPLGYKAGVLMATFFAPFGWGSSYTGFVGSGQGSSVDWSPAIVGRGGLGAYWGLQTDFVTPDASATPSPGAPNPLFYMDALVTMRAQAPEHTGSLGPGDYSFAAQPIDGAGNLGPATDIVTVTNQLDDAAIELSWSFSGSGASHTSFIRIYVLSPGETDWGYFDVTAAATHVFYGDPLPSLTISAISDPTVPEIAAGNVTDATAITATVQCAVGLADGEVLTTLPVKSPKYGLGKRHLMYAGTTYLPPMARRQDGTLEDWVIRVQAKHPDQAASFTLYGVKLMAHEESQFVAEYPDLALTEGRDWHGNMRYDERASVVLYTSGTETQNGQAFPIGCFTLGAGDNAVGVHMDGNGGRTDTSTLKGAIQLSVIPRYEFQVGTIVV